jgi:secreted Zn-dependent insulinase-like peptidase
MFTDDPSAPFSHAELELFESLIGESDPNSLVYGELRRQGLSYDSEITLFHNYEPGVHILQIRFSALTKKDLKRSLSVLRTVLANIAEGEFVDAWVLGWAKETTVHRLDAAAQSPIDDSPVLPRVYDIIEREGIPALLDAEIKVTTGDAVASVKTDDLARLARAILESPKIAVHFDGPDANKSSKLRENQTLIDRTFSLSSKKRARR